MAKADLQLLEAKLSYTFRNRNLLVRALTHKSFSSETRPARSHTDNEQLEFFGDSVLGFLVSELLVQKHPEAGEGVLSRAKSHMVSALWLRRAAQDLNLGEFLQLGRGEELGGGREKLSLLANAIEALIAALYLDGGMDAARAFVRNHVYSDSVLAAQARGDHANYKGELWERSSISKLPRPEYTVVETAGPAHAPLFVVEARLGDLFQGRGEGSSKKAAEQNAARSLLETMAAPADSAIKKTASN